MEAPVSAASSWACFRTCGSGYTPLGACTDHVHPHLGAGIHQGMGHVVAITDKDKLAAFEDFLVLHDGK